MTHAEMDELYELYAMGVLEQELRGVIDGHLTEKCEHCELRVRQPPAALRERVLRSIDGTEARRVVPPFSAQPSRGRIFGWVAALAALLVAFLFLGVQNRRLVTQLQSVSVQLAVANRDRTALEAALKNLSRSETRTVQFGKADQPHGRVFVTRDRGVVFVASSLPRLQSGRTFQLWLVPDSGAPRSAGLFGADDQGLSVRVSDQPVDSQTKAVAVSIEPATGSDAPTSTPIIVVPVGE